jgi:hypothetical protein
LPAIGFGAGSMAIGYLSGRQQALARLESVGACKESEINAWVRSLQGDWVTVMNEAYTLDWARAALALDRNERSYDISSNALRKAMEAMLYDGLEFGDRLE